mmetsp:Transcript_22400/g.64301  ORF Transcript_22400/g.64301 Transcript_22400/m.64301 type:complete len:202 (-) Transcript_22400:68-673(-)
MISFPTKLSVLLLSVATVVPEASRTPPLTDVVIVGFEDEKPPCTVLLEGAEVGCFVNRTEGAACSIITSPPLMSFEGRPPFLPASRLGSEAEPVPCAMTTWPDEEAAEDFPPLDKLPKAAAAALVFRVEWNDPMGGVTAQEGGLISLPLCCKARCERAGVLGTRARIRKPTRRVLFVRVRQQRQNVSREERQIATPIDVII